MNKLPFLLFGTCLFGQTSINGAAVDELLENARAGDTAAQLALAIRLRDGKDTAKDEVAAPEPPRTRSSIRPMTVRSRPTRKSNYLSIK